MVDSVEGDQVRLDVPAEEAKSRLGTRIADSSDVTTGRTEPEHNLERSFAGTYR
jgi:hypothetical protein